MNFLQRIKNIWILSGMEIAHDAYKKVVLSVPRETQPKLKKLATIIETNKPDMFRKDV